MKKIIVLFVVCCITHFGFAQDLIKLEHSDIKNSQFIESNNLQDLANLISSSQTGFAYLGLNKTTKKNEESGIKLLQLKGEQISKLNSSLDFASSVQMIIIEISDPSFKTSDLDCLQTQQFTKLKYIYFRYTFEIDSNTDLQRFDCFTNAVKQFYSIKIPS